jgi:hypothetical protein
VLYRIHAVYLFAHFNTKRRAQKKHCKVSVISWEEGEAAHSDGANMKSQILHALIGCFGA